MSAPAVTSRASSTDKKIDLEVNQSERNNAETQAADWPDHYSRVSNWFRSLYIRTVLVRICAFCAIGIWAGSSQPQVQSGAAFLQALTPSLARMPSPPPSQNAITSTGAGSTLATEPVNGVDAFSLLLTVSLCFAGPWGVRAVGVPFSMMIATYGYCLYPAGLQNQQAS